MSLEDAVLTRFPHPATRGDYAQAAEEVEGLLCTLPGAIAVYRIGGVTAPGISDLDRVVVVEGGQHVTAIWSRLSDRSRYLAMHSPFLVDAPTFRRHRWIADLQPLEIAWGEPQKIEQRPAREYCERLIAAEALVVTALKLAKQALTGRVKVRPLLCELYSVRCDLSLARLPREAALEAWALADEATRVREEWWSYSCDGRVRRFRRLLKQSQPAVAEALQALAARVDPRCDPGPLPLAAEWGNVTLIPGDPAESNGSFLSALSGHSRRLAEARWRWSRREAAVPPGIISLLAGLADSAHKEFRAERGELARRYRAFLRANPGYSGIGQPEVFAP
jgi:hypothetical protein